ncbi:MAG: YCF48-related protein, partial [Bacteroidota bacterium]
MAASILIPGRSLAQAWVAQTSGVSSALSCVSFVGKDTGSVCGVSGVILRTTNGGTTWTSQTSGTTNDLNWIRLFNGLTGTAVGESGTIRRTTNGGTSWTSQTSGTTQDLSEAFFVDASIAFVVGTNGTILKTTNAGTTWTSQTSGTTNDINGIFFTSSSNGVAIGESGTIRRTTNGGTTWTGVTSGTTNFLHELRFWDANNGIIVGLSGTVLTTSNGGTSWIVQTSGTTTALVGLAVTDSTTALATGGSGTIRRSTDRGVTWASQTSGTTSAINEIAFPEVLVGTVVGNSGIIRRTVTGGEVIPLFSVSPTALAFGNVVAGLSKLDSVTVTNTGIATLSISSVSSTNGEFSVSPSSASIAASGTQKFYITFSPTNGGPETGSIVFSHNAPGTPDTVSVSGTGTTYTITSSASAGGSIAPSGSVSVNHGANQSFTITPNSGYHIDSVVVDGVNQGAIAGYNFLNVTANHTIAAYFSINTYTITATASAGGSIAPSGAVSVNHGANQSFTITPNSGYHIDSVVVDGANQGAITNHNFLSVTANHTIAAYFSINAYTITATASAGGLISPSGSVSVNHGAN